MAYSYRKKPRTAGTYQRGIRLSPILVITVALFVCFSSGVTIFLALQIESPTPFISQIRETMQNHACYEGHTWNELPQGAKEAAISLGYTMVIWDGNQKLPALEKYGWDELPGEAKQAAETLGHTRKSWDYGDRSDCTEVYKKKQTRAPNLLFIMTDQQRYDALSASGNKILRTPNIDRIANEGVNFGLCYSQCPVCGPARTSIMTGRTIEHTAVANNGGNKVFVANTKKYTSYDQILSNQGYATEYYGKWHAPFDQALKYDNVITPPGANLMQQLWGRGPTMQMEYWDYLEKHNIPFVNLAKNANKSEYVGMQLQLLDQRTYKTNPLDSRHGMKPGSKINADGKNVRQPDIHGISTIPIDHTLTAFQAKQGIQALERLARQDRPFSLHLSFHSPHTPMTPSEPFASMYNSSNMHSPPSISDPMDNSPYKGANMRQKCTEYADRQKIKYMIANYYALIKEIDQWIGKILSKVDELGLTDNTMVVFTSDHGEMLGSHGMREKSVFYEESVHVPLMIRFPGRISPGTLVDDKPVSHIDLFPTILDYLEIKKHPSDGESLRTFIDGGGNDETYAVSEWDSDALNVPHLMIRSKRWKFLCPCYTNSKVMNVLYDLKDDPNEMNNLLGHNPNKKKYAQQGQVMKEQLILWLEKVGSRHLEEVRKRKII